MDDPFEARVRAAAAAAWWTLIVAFAFFMLQWAAYLQFMSTKPGWVLSFWGAGATWENVHTVWLYGLTFLKLTLWPLALGALWLTFWARQLRKRAPAA